MPQQPNKSTALTLTRSQLLDDPTCEPLNRVLRFLGGQVAKNASDISGLLSATGATGITPANTWAIVDTHANRIANFNQLIGNYPLGVFYYEIDRNSLYQSHLVAGQPVFQYISGLMRGALTALPTDLRANDNGFAFQSTTVGLHRYYWNSGWFYEGDYPGIAVPAATATALPTSMYHVADGSSVTIADPNNAGGTTTITLPNLSAVGGNNVFLEAGAFSGPNPTAALALHWAAGAQTDDESGHTHPMSQGVFGITPGATNITVDIGNPTGGGNPHHHSLSDTNAPMQTPTEVHGGLPLRMS